MTFLDFENPASTSGLFECYGPWFMDHFISRLSKFMLVLKIFLGRISPKYGTHQRKLGTVMPCVERPIRRPNNNMPKENENNEELQQKSSEQKAIAPFIASSQSKSTRKAGVRQRPALKDQNSVGCQAVHITSPSVSLHCPFQEIVVTDVHLSCITLESEFLAMKF